MGIPQAFLNFGAPVLSGWEGGAFRQWNQRHASGHIVWRFVLNIPCLRQKTGSFPDKRMIMVPDAIFTKAIDKRERCSYRPPIRGIACSRPPETVRKGLTDTPR